MEADDAFVAASAALRASATTVNLKTAEVLAAAVVGEAAVTGPTAATATALGMANSCVAKVVASTVADRVPASDVPAAESALYIFMGIALMVVGS